MLQRTSADHRKETRHAYPQRQALSKVFAEALEHVPAVLVDVFGGRRGPVLGKHAAPSFKGFARRASRGFLGQLSKPSLQRQTLQCGFRLQRSRLVVGKFNDPYDHSFS
jgi:hypothetical protein